MVGPSGETVRVGAGLTGATLERTTLAAGVGGVGEVATPADASGVGAGAVSV